MNSELNAEERKRSGKFYKKPLFPIMIAAVILCIVIAVFLLKDPAPQSENAAASGVRIVEEGPDEYGLYSYRVNAALPKTDFSSVGRELADKIAGDWAVYDGMTMEERIVSSHAPGFVALSFDNWDDCENAIGFTVEDPLESLDWLNKTGYFGAESSVPDMPARFIQVNAISSNTDRQVREILIESGYSTGNVHISLRSTLSADKGSFTNENEYTIGIAYNERNALGLNTVLTGSGIPVLTVNSDNAYNEEAYGSTFSDRNAYWVQGNVFYALRVYGDRNYDDEILAAFERILSEI